MSSQICLNLVSFNISNKVYKVKKNAFLNIAIAFSHWLNRFMLSKKMNFTIIFVHNYIKNESKKSNKTHHTYF